MDEPTLTEAQARQSLIIIMTDREKNHSSYRNVPYRERYAAATADIETPVEHLQRAIGDAVSRDATGPLDTLPVQQ